MHYDDSDPCGYNRPKIGRQLSLQLSILSSLLKLSGTGVRRGYEGISESAGSLQCSLVKMNKGSNRIRGLTERTRKGSFETLESCVVRHTNIHSFRVSES